MKDAKVTIKIDTRAALRKVKHLRREIAKARRELEAVKGKVYRTAVKQAALPEGWGSGCVDCSGGTCSDCPKVSKKHRARRHDICAEMHAE